jgi:hypothetical protein
MATGSIGNTPSFIHEFTRSVNVYVTINGNLLRQFRDSNPGSHCRLMAINVTPTTLLYWGHSENIDQVLGLYMYTSFIAIKNTGVCLESKLYFHNHAYIFYSRPSLIIYFYNSDASHDLAQGHTSLKSQGYTGERIL